MISNVMTEKVIQRDESLPNMDESLLTRDDSSGYESLHWKVFSPALTTRDEGLSSRDESFSMTFMPSA